MLEKGGNHKATQFNYDNQTDRQKADQSICKLGRVKTLLLFLLFGGRLANKHVCDTFATFFPSDIIAIIIIIQDHYHDNS